MDYLSNLPEELRREIYRFVPPNKTRLLNQQYKLEREQEYQSMVNQYVRSIADDIEKNNSEGKINGMSIKFQSTIYGDTIDEIRDVAWFDIYNSQHNLFIGVYPDLETEDIDAFIRIEIPEDEKFRFAKYLRLAADMIEGKI